MVAKGGIYTAGSNGRNCIRCLGVLTWTILTVFGTIVTLSSNYPLNTPDSHNSVVWTTQQEDTELMRHHVELADGLVEIVSWQPINVEKEAENKTYAEIYHTLINRMDLECSDRVRMGSIDDGGWDVCVAGPYRPTIDNCLVYSFGINNDFSFDDAITKKYHCKLRAFDPTERAQEEYQRGKYVTFYPIGLSGTTGVQQLGNRPRNMSTLGDLRKRFGEENSVIDYLKMDIESSEWTSIESMLKDGFLSKYVKQMGIEFHFTGANRDLEYKRRLDIELSLEQLGFRKWMNHWNMHCQFVSKLTNHSLTHCNEVYFLNLAFLH